MHFFFPNDTRCTESSMGLLTLINYNYTDLHKILGQNLRQFIACLSWSTYFSCLIYIIYILKASYLKSSTFNTLLAVEVVTHLVGRSSRTSKYLGSNPVFHLCIFPTQLYITCVKSSVGLLTSIPNNSTDRFRHRFAVVFLLSFYFNL